MKAEHLSTIISLAITAGLFYLFYMILSPFLTPIAWAMVLSITFYPLYRVFLKVFKRSWAASLVTLIVILIIIIGPFGYLSTALVKEISETYRTIEEKGPQVIADLQRHPVVTKLGEKLESYIGPVSLDLKDAAIKNLKALSKKIGEGTANLFKNILVFAVSFLIMAMTIFFFLKDGNAIIGYIRGLLPFSDAQKIKLENQAKEMVIATIYGGVTVAIIQGILGGLAFLVLGLPSPIFWGSAMSILSLIPIFGTFIVWGPAGVILILSGSYAKGIGLLLFGFLIIGMVDNILKPIIIGGKTKLNTLLIFFSVLGGIKLFGFIGFILGPLIVALCLSLLEIYRSDTKGGEDAYTQ
ncbi:MAG: AI-2E family transporter [Nitrospirae bacterium]|nr:AI-2E family transporter [Nitrospirota bacterium]